MFNTKLIAATYVYIIYIFFFYPLSSGMFTCQSGGHSELCVALQQWIQPSDTETCFLFLFFAYLPVVTSNQENNRPRVVIRSIVVYTSHGIPMMNRPIYSYNKTAGLSKKRFFSEIRRTLIIYLNFRFSKKIKFNTWSNTVIFAKTSLFILLFIILFTLYFFLRLFLLRSKIVFLIYNIITEDL